MTTIQTMASIDKNHKLTLKVPKKVKPGPHQIVVLIDEVQKKVKGGRQPFPNLKSLNWNHWPSSSKFNREDIYGEEGR